MRKAIMAPDLEFTRPPSVVAYMLRAALPSAGRRKAGGFPPLRARWRGYRADPRELAQFLQLTGLRADGSLPLLYPQVAGFRVPMVIVTHPAFPLPIWRALQIRNHLVQHRPIPADAELEFETRVAAQRMLEKGAEVDLHTAVRTRDGLSWESLTTFYYRGRFPGADEASPLAAAPAVGERLAGEWRTLRGVGWRFAGLTGDYNGIHYGNLYARLADFPRAFHHPQLMVGQCLARMQDPDPGRPQRLDAWLKGPVFYGTDVRLRATAHDGGQAFALDVQGDARPALLGRWIAASGADARLLDPQDGPA
jgi:acyl dehydratase